MKRCFSFVMSFVLLICSVIFPVSLTYADDNTRVYADYTECFNAGSTVKIPICIDNNQGIMGFRLNFTYDSEMLTPDSVEGGEVITNGLEDNIDSDAEPGTFKVYCAQNSSFSENGVLFYINFSVNANACGKTILGISYSQEDTFDESYNDVVLYCEDLEVNVDNNNYSSHAKIKASAEKASVGEAFKLKLTISQIKAIESAQLSLSYSKSDFTLVSAIVNSDLNYFDTASGLILGLSGITDEMNNSDIVELCFKCNEECAAGEYEFNLASSTEGVFCTDCTVSVKASDVVKKANIIADEISGNFGDEITVPLRISGNPGIMGYRLSFEYNAEELEAVSAKAGEEFSGNFDDSIGLSEGVFDVIWSANEPVSKDGVLLSLTFKVITKAQTPSVVKISYLQDDTFDGEYKDIVLNCVEAAVNLNGYIKPDDSSGGSVPKTIKSAALNQTEFVYDGKVKTPAVTVVDTNGNTVSENNYSLVYSSGRRNIGAYSVKITFKGDYSGSQILFFNIVPKGTKIKKAAAKKKSIKVTWKKQKKQTTGYQLQYSTDKAFKKCKTINIKKNKITAKTIKKLKSNKKYYVRIRTYKTVKGKNYFSKWSKAKAVKVK